MNRLLLIGDSTTYGRGANPEGAAGVTGSHIDSPCRQLSRKLTALGITSDSHSVVGMGNNSFPESTELYFNATEDVSVTLDGWDDLDFDSIGGRVFQSNEITGILLFEFDNVDSVALGLPVRTYGVIQYRIDGGDWILFDQNASNQTGVDEMRRIEIDLGFLGAHTVEFQETDGTRVYVNYVEAWDSSSQVVVIPWGARGYTVSQLDDDLRPWSYKAALEYVPFDTVLLNIGINDVRSGGSGITQTEYEAHVTNYVNAVKAANPDAGIVLVIPNDISTGLSYLPEAITGLANTLNVSLVDFRDGEELETYDIANAAGHMTDTLHPSDTGYNNGYDVITPVLLNILDLSSIVSVEQPTAVSITDIVDPDHEINSNSADAFKTQTVRLLGHVDDTAGTDDPNKMAIFTSNGIGYPWVKANHYNPHLIYTEDNDTEVAEAIVIFPHFDYT